MRVIVDVMGGDNAPLELLKGVILAWKELDVSFVLVGNRQMLEEIAAEHELDLSPFDIVHTEEVITMEDAPLSVMRAKKDSSMAMGLRLLANGDGDVFVSAGNTGALFTGATLIVRKVRGIQRAAIGSVLPAPAPCLLLDTGANVTVNEECLEQFAVMGSAYVKKVFRLDEPSVALLNNGTEECKGTPLHVAAYHRLCACSSIRFVGNVEGNAVPFGVCNVVVTDGFTGNVFVKTMEGMGKLMLGLVKQMFTKSGISKLSALMVKRSLRDIKKSYDPAEYGGSPFLGISKPVVKAHGGSDAKSFKSAIRNAVSYARSGVIFDIAEEAERFAALRRAEHAEKENNGEETCDAAQKLG